MKCTRLTCLASLLALATALQLAAQDLQDHHKWHHHYKLINVGTFGGPQNYINGDDLLVPYIGSSQDINNAGTLIGWADTSTLDPNPNFCFTPIATPPTLFSGGTASGLILEYCQEGGAAPRVGSVPTA
jgi:hypothetical protein